MLDLDEFTETDGRHGLDISAQSMDFLDKAALKYAIDISETSKTAIDIGCGKGAQGVRFASVGVNTTLVDKLDMNKTIADLNSFFDIGEVTYIQKDIRNVCKAELSSDLGLIYSQRFFHYLTFDEARVVLNRLTSQLCNGGKVFLSMSGLNSELSEGYSDKNTEIQNRYSTLSEKMAEKHKIHNKVCLYSEQETKHLLQDVGLQIQTITESDFGNIKVIASLQID